MGAADPRLEPSPLLKSFFLIDPLILIATWLAAHALLTAALGALVVIAATAILGRVFCGWFCPLGTLHAIAGWLFDRWRPDRKRRDHWSQWQTGKYYLLVGLLAMAALGGHWVCIFDPLVLLYRTTTTALLPATAMGRRGWLDGNLPRRPADRALAPDGRDGTGLSLSPR